MQDDADTPVLFQPHDDDLCRSVVSDLVSLAEHVRASITQIESAIARGMPAVNQEAATSHFVLDDVTPRFTHANAMLNTCKAGLDTAIRVLRGTEVSRQGTGGSAEHDPRRVRYAGRG